MANDSMGFLLEFLRHPTQTGAVAPSSRFLAERMLEWLNFDDAQNVLEYGPGGGAITEFIVQRLRPKTRFLAIEMNPAMAQQVRSRLPTIEVEEDSVENVRAVCDRRGMDKVNCIVCSLPWTSFPDELQDRLLAATMSVLPRGGQLVTFAYLHGIGLPGGQSFAKKLPTYFSEVTRSRPVWRNMPPAIVYRCRR